MGSVFRHPTYAVDITAYRSLFLALPARNLARIQKIRRIHGPGEGGEGGRGGRESFARAEARRIATAIFCSAPAFLFNKLRAEIYRERGAAD